MPSTPLICCSSGIVTADSTTCAFAPTKLLLTVTWGGARVGYSEIGRPGMETAPAKMISRAHTVAKIGRLMKKSTKPSRPSVRAIAQHRWSTPWAVSTDWLYGCSVNEELDPRDDDLFAGLQT